jgi:AcrR family transcriptional regulator
LVPSQRGYENTTVIEIAERAGLTKSTFFRHFPDKREVLFGRAAFVPARRELVADRRAVIAANPELQEREALKGLALTAAMTDALRRRGVPDLTACVAAQLGALALKIAYERWSDIANDDDFSELARKALSELQAAVPRTRAAD